MEITRDTSPENTEKPQPNFSVQYTKVLHQYGLGSPQAEALKRQYPDPVEQKRAATLERMMHLKKDEEGDGDAVLAQ